MESELWQDLYDDDSAQREFIHHIYGSDISKVALEVTEKNIKAAGLAKYITLEHKDFEDFANDTHPAVSAYNEALIENPDAPAPMLVFNPPYGKRLITDVPTFYRMVGTSLKKGFQNCEAWVISSEEKVVIKDARGNKSEAEPLDLIGLKPSIKIDLNNGGISCQLRKYEMFKGKFQEFRAEGNELEKKTADEGEKKFTKLEHKYAKKERKSEDKGGKKFDKDKKKFDKDGKKFDKDRKKPEGDRFSKKERDYEVCEDGSIVAKKADAKPARERKPFDKEKKERKPFDNKKPFDKEKKENKRGPKVFDPNRPMFREDFDASKHVLDLSDDK